MSTDAAGGSATPQVSVLMAVRDGGAFLEPALRSMMAQTLRDIEIVVVDDASTDGTPEVLDRLAREDGRIRVERLAANLRLPRALNRGLEIARAPLIARMDADDLSEPRRLEVQKRYMDAHLGVVLAGAGYRRIDEEGRTFQVDAEPLDAFAVRWLSRLRMPIIHPTFMFRAVLPGGERPRYDPAWTHSEDYDLTVRLLQHGDAARLPDLLLDWRAHQGSITGTSWRTCQGQGLEISHRFGQATLPAAVAEALMPFRRAYYLGERVPPAAIFAGLRALAAHDKAPDPSRRRWANRQLAKHGRLAMTRAGYGHPEVIRAFLGPGRDFLAAMAMRTLEAKRLLPAILASEPQVAASEPA